MNIIFHNLWLEPHRHLLDNDIEFLNIYWEFDEYYRYIGIIIFNFGIEIRFY